MMMIDLTDLDKKYRVREKNISGAVRTARTTATPQKINLAVVGDSCVGKTILIYYWLSLNANHAITSGIYSKIFWINEEPVQINIYKISPGKDPDEQKRTYHTILYIYDLEKDDSRLAIPGWTELMRDRAGSFTYQAIWGVSQRPNEELELESREVDNIRRYYAKRRTSYFRHSLRPSDSLSSLLDDITLRAYRAMMEEKISPGITGSIELKDLAKSNFD